MQKMLTPELPCRELLDALPAAIYTTDADGRVAKAGNPAATGRRPRDASDATGQHLP